MNNEYPTMKKLSVILVAAYAVLAFGCTKICNYWLFPIAEPNPILVTQAGKDGSVSIYTIISTFNRPDNPSIYFTDRSTPVAYPQLINVYHDGVEVFGGCFQQKQDLLVAEYEDIHIEATSSTYQENEFNPRGYLKYSIGKCPEGVKERKITVLLTTAEVYKDNTGFLLFLGAESLLNIIQTAN